MATGRDNWTYGDTMPDPHSQDLMGLKAKWILSELPNSSSLHVLDFGAGEGKYLRLVREVRPDAKLVGIDVRMPNNPPDFEFHLVPEGAQLPFTDNTFDVIVSCDVLEHVSSAARSLDEIRRVLRVGGHFIGFVPLEGGIGPYGFFRLFDPDIFLKTKDHRHAFSRTEMHSLMVSRFDTARFEYSYHILGGLLDAVFFASFRLPNLGTRLEHFWRGQDNHFYRKDPACKEPSLVGRLTGLANRIAYWESRILRRMPFGANGLHFSLKKTNAKPPNLTT